jgi:hypothetical protein
MNYIIGYLIGIIISFVIITYYLAKESKLNSTLIDTAFTLNLIISILWPLAVIVGMFYSISDRYKKFIEWLSRRI